MVVANLTTADAVRRTDRWRIGHTVFGAVVETRNTASSATEQQPDNTSLLQLAHLDEGMCKQLLNFPDGMSRRSCFL